MLFIGTLIGFLIAIATHPGYWWLGALLGWTFATTLKAQLDIAYAPAKSTAEKIKYLEQKIAMLHLLLTKQETAQAITQAEESGNPDSAEAGRTSDDTEAETTAEIAQDPVPTLAPRPFVIRQPTQHIPSQPLLDVAVLTDAFVASTPTMPAWFSKLWAGNPLAKIGIVFLFFAMASGLKLAAEYGFMPIWLRLLAAALSGVGLIIFGRQKAKTDHYRNFGLAIQGGGFAILYLVVYFMLQRYAMIAHEPAFAIFAVLGAACLFMATWQNAPALAVLGIAGAFLAPILADGNANTPLHLFSYFVLLNAMIIGVSWFKSWKSLNITGFILTLAICMTWAVDRYQAQHYWVTQIFTVIFLLAYSAMPAATALFKAPGKHGWQDGISLFGTPLMGAFLQSHLMANTAYGLAWSAGIGALWYFTLWSLLFLKRGTATHFFERAHLGIALALLTVSIPLAFDAQVTSAFWAAEGAAALWFGVHQRRMLSQAAGLLMQIAAGIALVVHWGTLNHRLPVFNDAVFGACIVSLAGLFSARLLRAFVSSVGKDDKTQPIPPILPVIWSMMWWFGTGLAEIDRFVSYDDRTPFILFFVTVTVLLLEGVAKAWAWPNIRRSAILLPATAWLCAISVVSSSNHPLFGLMLWALPIAVVISYLHLAIHEKRQETAVAEICALRHISLWWLILWVIPTELTWQAQQIAPTVELWPMVAWGLCLAAGIALPAIGYRAGRWPFSNPAARYVQVGVVLPLLALCALLIQTNFRMPGENSGLPYLPILNFFDLTQLVGIASVFLLSKANEGDIRKAMRWGVATLGFVWLSCLTARIAHFWDGIPFEIHALAQSPTFQSLLTLTWTTVAIGAMISASRRAHRPLWFNGFALLGVVCVKLLLFDASGRGTLIWTGTLMGVAVLILAASYFAPIPPARATLDHTGG